MNDKIGVGWLIFAILCFIHAAFFDGGDGVFRAFWASLVISQVWLASGNRS